MFLVIITVQEFHEFVKKEKSLWLFHMTKACKIQLEALVWLRVEGLLQTAELVQVRVLLGRKW